jgi:hypothetical protein
LQREDREGRERGGERERGGGERLKQRLGESMAMRGEGEIVCFGIWKRRRNIERERKRER